MSSHLAVLVIGCVYLLSVCSLSPAGFSTKQRLGGIWLLVYHLNECQRSASGQMEAEQMAL